MAQISRRRLNPKVWDQILHLFLRALIETKSEAGAKGLTNSFLTSTERVMLAKRLALFFFIEKGLTVREIADRLKISTATVVRWQLAWSRADANFKKVIRQIMAQEEINRLFDKVLAVVSWPQTIGRRRWSEELARKKKH